MSIGSSFLIANGGMHRAAGLFNYRKPRQRLFRKGAGPFEVAGKQRRDMVKMKQRLIVECELEGEQASIMAELQRIIIGRLAGKDGCTAVTFSWVRETELGMGQGLGHRQSQSEGQGQAEYSSRRTSPVVPPGPVGRKLSERELEISQMLCANLSVRKIAGRLHISENTVKKHIQNIKKTLGIRVNGLDFVYELQGRLNEAGNAE